MSCAMRVGFCGVLVAVLGATAQAGDYVTAGAYFLSGDVGCGGYYMPPYVAAGYGYGTLLRPIEHHDVRPYYDGYGGYVVYPNYYAPAYTVRGPYVGARYYGADRYYAYRSYRYSRRYYYGGYGGAAYYSGGYSRGGYGYYRGGHGGRSARFGFRRGYGGLGFGTCGNRGRHHGFTGFYFSYDR